MSALNRRNFIKAGLATGTALMWGGFGRRAIAAAADRPNIVFILADDYGIDGVGCYGSDRFKGKTPNLDALAATGIRFERCYSTPLCGPTRCEIITGRYPFRTGGLTNGSAGNPRPQDESSVARTLKQAGYATCHAGKWRQMGAQPSDWGFDEYVSSPTAGGHYWITAYTKNGQEVKIEKEGYYPDIGHDFAMDFMARNKDKPFFLYYASHLVHGPILRTPDTREGVTGAEAFYNDNVAYLDKQVGKVVAELDKLGLREKTLIVFSADNGTAHFGQPGVIGGRQINGQKGTMQEGGTRVPLIANWKGASPAGCALKDLVDFSDIFPTFAEVAGAKLPEGITLDGRSFAPQLRGGKGNPREWIFVQLGRNWYVRDDGWKLNQSGELFDMSDAPFVEKPVPAGSGGEEVEAARKRLQAALDKLNPAAGKVISEADQAAEKERARKRRKNQDQPKKAGKKQKAK